jgi:protein-tyrosine phosphatase
MVPPLTLASNLMIDLHTHILPGIDDGPKTWDDSLALAKALSEAGVSEVAATSHIKPPVWPNEPQPLADLRAELVRKLEALGIALVIHPGAEHWYCGAVLDSLAEGGGQPYGNVRAFLVEIHPNDDPPLFDERLYSLQRQGLKPVLAHVERYRIFEGKKGRLRLRGLVERGITAQINLGTLGRGFGWARGGNAKRFLMDGLVGLVCGDCHSSDDVPAAYETGLSALRKLGGESAIQRLLTRNPRSLLAGKEVDPWQPA